MKAALIIFLSFVFGLIVVDVLWLNSKVVGLEKLGRVVSDKVIGVEEQINFLAARQDVKVTTSADEETQTPIEIAPKQIVVTQKAAAASEVFIPLGSGSTSSTEWVDTGAQGYVDSSVYSRAREVYFQASLKSNSGVVSARLKEIGSSEISHNTPTATFKTSASFSLLNGNKLYVVQLRSETGQEVFVENARLRLVLR